MEPFDLAALAKQHSLRTVYDPTAAIESSRTEKRWLVRIPCKRGWIGIHSDVELIAFCEQRNYYLKRFEKTPGVRHFRLDDEKFSATFNPAALIHVAKLLKAKKRRQVSQTTLDRLAETAFRKKSHAVATA